MYAYRSLQLAANVAYCTPTLDAAHKLGLKVVLLCYRLEDGATTMEQVAKDFGNHPAVIGFNLRFHAIARAQLIGEYEVPAED